MKCDLRTGKWTFSLYDLVMSAFVTMSAFLLCWQAGSRGFFAFDQSIIFDGAYRTLKGQVVYRDFVMPTGPVACWIQTLFFLVGGVSYESYLANAVTGNCLATISVMYILRCLYQYAKLVPYIGALLTAIWFYPPFGTPSFEQTAFLIVLLSTDLVVFSMSLTHESSRSTVIFLAGVLAGFALLTKQNAGAFGSALPAGLVLVSSLNSRRAALIGGACFLLGLAATGLMFWLWIHLYSDPYRFWKHFWVIPSGEGARRFFNQEYRPLAGFSGSRGLYLVAVVMIISTLTSTVYFLIGLCNLSKSDELRRGSAAGCLALSALVAQDLFIFSTNNQVANGLPFLGLVVAVGIASTWRLLRMSLVLSDQGIPLWLPGPTIARMLLAATYTVLLCCVGWRGYRAAMTREVHDIFSGAVFSLKCDVPILRYVKWPEKLIRRRGQILSPEELEAVVQFLKEKNQRFLVINDYTILYAMLDKPAPQPFLWFHKGLTYPLSYEKTLDQWFVDSLKSQRVEARSPGGQLLDERV